MARGFARSLLRMRSDAQLSEPAHVTIDRAWLVQYRYTDKHRYGTDSGMSMRLTINLGCTAELPNERADRPIDRGRENAVI